MNTIKVDTSTVVTEVAPQLTEHCESLSELFEKITNLEQFVGIVKKNMQAMDDEISACERKHTLQVSDQRVVWQVLRLLGIPLQVLANLLEVVGMLPPCAYGTEEDYQA